MRKPAVVVTLLLVFLITLARRLAQPTIADPQSAATEIAEVSSAAPPAAPVHPTLHPTAHPPVRPAIEARPVETKPVRKTLRNAGQVARKSVSEVQDVVDEKPVYRALLASPESAFRNVRDHGTHGIAAPKWIEALSGAKARVPVRDFSDEAVLKGRVPAEGLSLPVDSRVDSTTRSMVESRVDSAH